MRHVQRRSGRLRSEAGSLAGPPFAASLRLPLDWLPDWFPDRLPRQAVPLASRAGRWVAVGVGSVLVSLGSSLFLPGTAEAFVGLSIDCPAESTPGQMPTIDVTLNNQTPSAIDVRVMAGYVGSGNTTLFGKGFGGPAMALPTRTLTGFESLTEPLISPPDLPAGPNGTVVEYYVMGEWEVAGDRMRAAKTCLIALPEASSAAGLSVGIAWLSALRRRSFKRRNADCPLPERESTMKTRGRTRSGANLRSRR